MAQLMTRLLKGAAGGVAATLVMSVAMLGAKRLGLLGEPPPRRLTRRLLAPLGRFAPKGKALDATALLAHFGFGASMGGLFALLPTRLRGTRGGALFGFTVWLVNYAGWLPRARLMPRPESDRPGRPTTMIAAHLVFGVTLAAVDRRLSLDSLLGATRSRPFLGAPRSALAPDQARAVQNHEQGNEHEQRLNDALDGRAGDR